MNEQVITSTQSPITSQPPAVLSVSARPHSAIGGMDGDGPLGEPSAENEETLSLLSEIDKTPQITQREISLRLQISLGKTNYLINELVKKGILKARNFSSRPGKMVKVRYLLTPKGLEEKMRLVSHFLERKEKEYRYLKDEWERLQKIRQEQFAAEPRV